MRSLLGRFHRPMSRGLVNNMLTMNNLGDGSTLSLDFTTGVLDPRLTFSRASTATFVNSSGYVEYAAHNLYYNTNFATITTGTANPSLTGTGWGYALNSGTSFSATFNTNGSVTMAAVAGRIGLYRSAGFAGTGRRLIFSVDITSVGDTGLPPSQLVNEGTKTNDAYYIDGTLWTSGNVVGPCTLSFVFTSNPAGNAATYFGLGMSSNSTATNITFANPRWGFYGGVNQLAYSPNTAATNANYLTAEYHAPRFDYSPTNIGEPRGLLVEGSSINACTYSEDFANAAWSKNNATQTPASGISPDNTNTATLFAEIVGYGKHSLERSITVTAGNIYTFSVFLKEASSNSRRYACVQVADGQATAARYTVVFDLQTGTVTANGVTSGTLVGSPTDVAHSITAYRDGWYRVTVTMKFVSSPCYPVVMLSDISTLSGGNNQPFYTAASPVKGFLVYGAQLELGSGASSLIPTGASQVTRNADACSMTGSDFTNVFGDGSLGTIICSHEFSRANHGVAHQPTPFAIGSYTATNARGYSYGNYTLGVTSNYGWVYTSAAFSPASTSAAFVAKNKCAIAYNGLALTAALNGTTNSTTGSGTITVSSAIGLQIGYNTSPRDFINACVSNIKFYPTALTAAQLQTLTAL